MFAINSIQVFALSGMSAPENESGRGYRATWGCGSASFCLLRFKSFHTESTEWSLLRQEGPSRLVDAGFWFANKGPGSRLAGRSLLDAAERNRHHGW